MDYYPNRFTALIPVRIPHLFGFLTFCFFFISFDDVCAKDVIVPDSRILKTVQQQITLAQTYFWFGIEEKGNMEAFQTGLEHLANAKEALKDRKAGLPEKEMSALKAEIFALQSDLEQQAELAHDTLFGVFPLIRFLTVTLFSDAMATGTFKLVDDPSVTAATAASLKLASTFSRYLRSRPQLDVVFNSVPMATALENEALYIFNNSDKFFVHSKREVIAALGTDAMEFGSERRDPMVSEDSDELWAAFEANLIDRDVSSRLLNDFGADDLLVVTLRRMEANLGDNFFVAEGRVFSKGVAQALDPAFAMGFSRDRRDQLVPIILTNIMLLGFAPVLYAFFTLHYPIPRKRRIIDIEMIMVAFLVGRCLPWFLIPPLLTLAPAAETLALLSFWWVAFVGLVIFAAPVLLIRIVLPRLAGYFPSLHMDGKGGVLAISSAFGTSAYLAGPVFLYFQDYALTILVALLIASSSAAYLLGRSFDEADGLPVSVWTVSTLFSVMLGMAIFHGNVLYLTILAGITFVMTVAIGKLFRKSAPQNSHTRTPNALQLSNCDADVQRMAGKSAPAFQPSSIYHTACAQVHEVLSKKVVWLLLTGSVGTGKTTMAQAVSRYLQKEYSTRNKSHLLLSGTCIRYANDSTSLPYAPFREAFAPYLDMSIFGNATKAIQRGSIIDDAFEFLGPLAYFFRDPGQSAETDTANKQDIYVFVSESLKKLIRDQAIILSIDDIQWMDEASRELLNHLLQAFPPGTPDTLTFILTTRDRTSTLLHYPELSSATIDIIHLTLEQKRKILTDGFGIDRETTDAIIERVEDGFPGYGPLTSLVDTVATLFRKGLLIKGKDGLFELPREKRKPSVIPLPEGPMEEIMAFFEKYPDSIPLIACAACLGREFEVRVLARALAKDRMDVIGALDDIETKTGMVYDVIEKDDVYAFRSNAALEMLKQRLHMAVEGQEYVASPQRVREFNARVAQALEPELEDSPETVFKIASLYAIAGNQYTDKAFSFAIAASSKAQAMYEFDLAGSYLRQAENLPRNHRVNQATLGLEKVLLNCEKAHVQGMDRENAAIEILDYLEENAGEYSADLLSIAARACYDGGTEHFNQELFATAVVLGYCLVSRAGTPAHRAEGHHYIGLSLPPYKFQERSEHLEIAFRLLDEQNDPSLDPLLAKVANSLAELLSYGQGTAPERAKALFERSLEIKQRPGIQDLEGLALSHGGLGRLAFEAAKRQDSNTPDFSEARSHFTADIEISTKLGDFKGEALMLSHLGHCDRLEGESEEAIEKYQRSLELATDIVTRLFSTAGLLDCYCRLDATEQFEAQANDMHRLIENEPIRSDIASELLQTISQCEYKGQAEALGKLYVILSKSMTKRTSDQQADVQV